MPNINLYQNTSGSTKEFKRPSHFDGGFFFSIGIFLLVLLSLGGMKFANSRLDSQKVLLEQERTELAAGFLGSDIDRIMDFQTRVDKSMENISSKMEVNKVFPAIEEFMIKGVVATSISYGRSSSSSPIEVNMGFATKDYWSVAKQLLSIKQSEKFSGVSISGLSSTNDGISFQVKTNLK